jgi:hypothetical protein
MIQIESLSAAFAGGGKAKSYKELYQESREPVEP